MTEKKTGLVIYLPHALGKCDKGRKVGVEELAPLRESTLA